MSTSFLKKTIPSAIAVCTLFCLVFTGCSGNNTIYIGFSGQLTGPSADIGVGARNGCNLAIEHINKAGGINGKRLVLLTEDDGYTPESAIAADNRLIKQGVVAIIGHLTSSMSVATTKHFNNDVIYISPTTSTPMLSGITDSFFRLIPSNASMATRQARHIAKHTDFNNIAIIYDIDNAEFTETYADAFQNEIQLSNKKIQELITYSSQKRTSWEPYAQLFKTNPPDAILIISATNDAASFTQYLSQQGIKIPIFVSHWTSLKEVLRRIGKQAEVITGFATHNPTDSSPAALRFQQQYKKRFGEMPTFSAYFAYDSIIFLAEALKLTEGKREGLLEALNSTPAIKGILNNYSLDPYGDAILNKFYIITISNGKLVTIATDWSEI